VQQSNVTSIVVPQKVSEPNRVFLTIASRELMQGLNAVTWSETFTILVSTDGGDSWKASTQGLPATGVRPLVSVAPSDPNTIYLTLNEGNSQVGATLLYASVDGGHSWTLRSDLVAYLQEIATHEPVIPNPRFPGFYYPGGTPIAIDPLDPQSIWSRNAHSIDGGRTWTQPPPSAITSATWFAVAHDAGTPARVVAQASPSHSECGDGCFISVSEDDGDNWEKWAVPRTVDVAATFGANRDDLWIWSGWGIEDPGAGIWRYDSRIRSWIDVTPVVLTRSEGPKVLVSDGRRPRPAIYAQIQPFWNGASEWNSSHIFRHSGR
jgi:hypothetical protein